MATRCTCTREEDTTLVWRNPECIAPSHDRDMMWDEIKMVLNVAGS